MKPRMLIVTNRFHPQVGGAEINIFLQAQELSRYFDVDVYTPMRDRDPRHEMSHNISITRGINLLNLRGHYPDLSTETLCPGAFFKSFLGRYDLVHCFPSLGRNTILALLAARVRRIPIFMSMFDLDDYATLLEHGMPLPTIFENQRRALMKWKNLFSRFNAIFTISTRELANIKDTNPNSFLSTVPVQLDEYNQTVDAPAFKQRYGLHAGLPFILCLGRVARIKGQDVLVRALPRLRERVTEFTALIVGRTDYEPNYVHEMQEFVARENLGDHVKLTGVMPREDVIAALKSCDVHVLPVRFMNSGAVVVETWAARRPVLHSDMIDPCYVVEGENGFTFRSEDTLDLCEKLVRILGDAELRKRMGTNGRRLVEEKFLYPHLIRQYLDAYRDYGGVEV